VRALLALLARFRLDLSMRVAPTSVLAVPLLAGTALAGCGGETASPTTPPTLATSDAAVAACSAEETANCARFQSCYANDLAGQYGTVANCETRRQVSCLAGLAATGTAATPSDVTSCAVATASESCESLLYGDPTPTACQSPAGSGAIGSGCSANAQCASAYCAVPIASACGTCQSPPTAGSSCANLVSCGKNLACYEGACVVRGASGDPCKASAPCATELGCVIPAGATGGTCQAEASPLGAACVPRNDVANGAGCDITQGLHCVYNSENVGTCQSVTTATAGQSCNSVVHLASELTYTVCIETSECMLQADGSQLCVERAADNAVCNTVTGPACMPPARCIGTGLDGGATGKCVLPGVASCR